MRGKSNNRFKLTANEKGWILYDVGNSAFILMVSTILPIYFNYLAENAGISSVDYLAYWGYAASIVTLIVAVLGPVLGTLADTKGFKKPIFSGCVIAGCLACVAMGITGSWISFLVVFVIAKVCFSASLVFYDSMLSDVTTDERMDIVSSNGYAYGYAGSCIPFIISLIFVLGYNKIGISLSAAMLISFVIVALWWFLMTVPLIKNYKQINYVERKPHAVKESFVRIKDTLCGVVKQKKIFLFLVAFFFYIDGVYTIIDMATACSISICYYIWKAYLKIQHRTSYNCLHNSVHRNYSICSIYEKPVAVLGISYICWYVSGRHTGVVTFLFCKDNTG